MDEQTDELDNTEEQQKPSLLQKDKLMLSEWIKEVIALFEFMHHWLIVYKHDTPHGNIIMDIIVKRFAMVCSSLARFPFIIIMNN